MNPPIILCGLGTVGWRVLDYLLAAGLPVVVIDTNCSEPDPRLEKVRLIQGDFRHQAVLEEAGVAQARGVLIVTADDLLNISATLMARHLNPSVRIVVRLFNQNLINRLGKAVTNIYALSVSALTAPLVALTALTGDSLGTFTLEDGRRQIAEVAVTPPSPLLGQTLREVAEKYRVLILAHLPRAGQERFLLDVALEARLAAGDHLVICGEPRLLTPMAATTRDDFLTEVLWAGWFRRLGRVVYRTLSEVDMLVKACTLAFFSVIVMSTLTYYYGIMEEQRPVTDSLYRTISVMATGADMHEEELKRPWQKFFVSMLRVSGAALTAAFTAIVTNYLLRARLGGALEVRRIPDGGHVVVCGLGNVGFRVVEELMSYGEKVVVIEQQHDSRFMATTRRLGVAVITGDATVLEVLRQAHADTAKAVVAATNNELGNLEIALLTRELNPQQRIVVRLSDDHLAQTLRQAANVRLALSIPSLAAPAFMAALFGDRVQSVFLVANRLLAVVELAVHEHAPLFLGQTLRALAIDYRLLPVRLLRGEHSAAHRPLYTERLEVGDRLVAIMDVADLERLMRRVRIPTDWAVEVTALPLPMRVWMAQLYRGHHHCDAETAEQALDHPPFVLAHNLTRGQAEDLLALLERKRVSARVIRG
ncbi:MAG: potassium channel family protein [Gemmataceae bacterium]